MLEESQDLMASLKMSAQQEQIKRAQRKILFQKVKVWTIRICVASFIFSAIFFPKETGSVIGKWIYNFFGTIKIESSK